MRESRPPLHQDSAYTRRLSFQALLDVLFREAPSHVDWQTQPVPDEPLQQAVALASIGPTIFNCSPMRVVFVRSMAAKQRLMTAVAPADFEKIALAPVTAIVAYDLAFHDHPPRLYPFANVGDWFNEDPDLAAATAFRNGTLQGAYLILAARALGLDCDPISGFDHAIVDREFFGQSGVRSNFLCNIGYGEPTIVGRRPPELRFDEIATTI